MLIDPEGRRLLAAGRHGDARKHFSQLLVNDPDSAASHSLGLSFALTALGRLTEADVALSHAETLAPDDPDLLAARASLHEQMGDEAAAMQAWLDLLARHPEHLPAAHNLGAQLYRLGYFAEAVQQHRETTRRHPHSAATWRDLGQALVALGDIDAGIEALRQANRLAPQDRDNRFALALALLRAERWAEGWPLYEARWRPGEAPPGPPGIPIWQGEDLVGKHLVVFAEQGFGDTLMFSRFLPLLNGLTAGFSLVVPAALKSLLSNSFPGTAIDTQPPAHADYRLALGSLPLRLLAFGQGQPPRPGRYLTPSASARAATAACLPAASSRLLGLTWRGQSRYSADRQRSLPLADLRRRSPQPQATHAAFQLDITATEQAKLAASGDLDLSPFLADFDHSAALLERLGGLVTVDTAMAHLAGGLDLPCHIAHRREGEWRWGADGHGSAWYGKCFPLPDIP